MSTEFNSAKALTEPEVQAFLNTLKGRTCRDSLMLELLATYGMRCGELLSLRFCDLNHITKTILIKGTKGSRDREFPVTDEIYDRLVRQMRIVLNSDYDKVFPISYHRLEQIWRFWRPAKKKLHSLRHTAAIRIYRQTKDIQMVQRILGHKSLQTTLIYQEFCYTQDEFKDVFGINRDTEPGHASASGENLRPLRSLKMGHEG